MILLLDTSGPVCKLTLVDADTRHEVSWEANRELAKDLLSFLEAELQQLHKEFSDITAIGVFRGPGSFTGLRIGLTVLNTLADTLRIPIVGETGEVWQDTVLARLDAGENEQLIMPLYANDPHITQPRK